MYGITKEEGLKDGRKWSYFKVLQWFNQLDFKDQGISIKLKFDDQYLGPKDMGTEGKLKDLLKLVNSGKYLTRK